MCEEKEGRRGSAGLCLGVSFHKCFATLVLKLEPCGNNHVQVYSMCSAWTVEGTNCVQNEYKYFAALFRARPSKQSLVSFHFYHPNYAPLLHQLRFCFKAYSCVMLR